MPELPDITIYLEALEPRLVGQGLEALRLGNPFVLRTVSPAPEELVGQRVVKLRRLAKQVVLVFERGHCAVLHLMIAGRLHWKTAGVKLPGRRGLVAFDFEHGTLLLTEAGTKRRASLRLLGSEAELEALDPGGLDPLQIDAVVFRERLAEENHTLKRALTDQRLLAGIGNAYSDEILLAAQLSPFKQTADLAPEEWERLYRAVRATLLTWTERLRREAGDGFPERVTAFREGMAVHGRYRQPCPVCGAPVQRIVYAERECNYCAGCQTGGRILADRALSRLLKDNWPKTLDELE